MVKDIYRVWLFASGSGFIFLSRVRSRTLTAGLTLTFELTFGFIGFDLASFDTQSSLVLGFCRFFFVFVLFLISGTCTHKIDKTHKYLVFPVCFWSFWLDFRGKKDIWLNRYQKSPRLRYCVSSRNDINISLENQKFQPP